MGIDDPVSAIIKSDNAEERSAMVPAKDRFLSVLGMFTSILAAASTGASAIEAAAASGILTVAGAFLQSAQQTRLKELTGYLYEEFQRLGATTESVNERLKAAEEKVEVIAEAFARAAEAKSSERVKRIAYLLAKLLLSQEEIQIEEARVMLEIAGELFDLDAYVLGRLYAVQAISVEQRGGRPEKNDVTQSWRKLRDQYPKFKEGSTNSSCARLQAHGLVMSVEPGVGNFDLQTYVFVITDFGIRFCRWCIADLN